MALPRRQPFSGLKRKLIIAFDVGTTYSGASYSLLDPGLVPTIQGVTRFPAQSKVGGDSKIPSILCYDRSGKLLAVGEEAVQYHETFMDDASDGDDDEWEDVQRVIRVEWFKLHLRPKTLSSEVSDKDLPPLPRGKTAIAIFSDFLGYLYRCTRLYIEESHPAGPALWQSIEEENIEFILTHPNGWEGSQQAQMRRAAVDAGLIDAGSGSRVHFVTEGEASLHFCINKGIMSNEAVPLGQGALVVDAGGGTIDLSAYARISSSNAFEEIARPRCCIQGSVMVSRRAKSWLEENLAGSKYLVEVDHMADVFDKSTKLTFRDQSSPYFIRFGTVRDKDLKYDIRSGQKKIAGDAIAQFFSPSVENVFRAILDQREESSKKIETVFLVGGFAASDWLFSELQRRLAPLGITLSRPDGHVNKAVADGAISFYLDHFVSVRMARVTYGIAVIYELDRFNAEHRRRESTSFESPSGVTMLSGGFYSIITKGEKVSETKEFRAAFCREANNPSLLRTLSEEILAFRGEELNPRWMDADKDKFSTLCTISADTSKLAGALTMKPNIKSGRPNYCTLNYEIIMLFGLTELKAQICWKENGVERRSPAQIIYDDDD